MRAHDDSMASGGMDLMAVSPAPEAVDVGKKRRDVLPADVGRGNDLQPSALTFELHTAVRPSPALPPARKSHVSREESGGAEGKSIGGKNVESKPLVAVATRARRGADHLVDKLVKHLDTAEVNDEAVGAVGALAVCAYTTTRHHSIRQGHPLILASRGTGH